jgi:hypothetical protein
VAAVMKVMAAIPALLSRADESCECLGRWRFELELTGRIAKVSHAIHLLLSKLANKVDTECCSLEYLKHHRRASGSWLGGIEVKVLDHVAPGVDQTTKQRPLLFLTSWQSIFNAKLSRIGPRAALPRGGGASMNDVIVVPVLGWTSGARVMCTCY